MNTFTQNELENNLESLEKKYGRTLIDNLPFLVWYKDKESNFLCVNKPFVEAACLNNEKELLGKNDLDIWNKELATSYIIDDKKVIESGKSKLVQEKIIVDNDEKWFETFKIPVYDDEKLLGTIGYSKDITKKILNQKKSEDLTKALKKEKEKYKALLALASDGVHIINRKGEILEFSESFSNMLGYSLDEVKNLNAVEWYEEFHSFTSKEFDNIKFNETFVFNSKFKKKDTTYLDVETNVKKILIDNKEYFYCSTRDISESLELKNRLKEERNKLDNIVNAIPDLLWMKDNNGRYVHCNNRFENFFGDSEKNIIGKTDYDYLDKKLADLFAKNDKKAMNSDIPLINYEIIPFASDGHKEYTQTIKRVVKNKDGEKIGVLGIGRDFTSSKKYQDDLVEQKKELETIFELSRDGLSIIDFETKFLKVNSSYTKITKLSKDELLNTSFIEISYEQEKIKELISEVIKSGYIDNIETLFFDKDNNQSNITISMSLLPDKKNIMIIVNDITKYKLFEQQNKLASMGEMIGNIAHQWRQPLSVISTISSGIKINEEFGIDNSENLSQNMTKIIEQTSYLSQTIDDFRTFLKDNKKKEKVSIKELLNKTLNIVNASLKNNYIQVIKDLDYDIDILGFKNELSQSFINIINNSKDAIIENNIPEEDRYIFISTKKIDDGIMIEIKDSGNGIPENIINRIFEPYFTTKHQSKGTGIGLSMAYQIITKNHDGNITVLNVENKYEGKMIKGACFRIYFS